MITVEDYENYYQGMNEIKTIINKRALISPQNAEIAYSSY